jgi:hypothetical protein
MTVVRWKDEVNAMIFFVIKMKVILVTNWCIVNSKGFMPNINHFPAY